MFSMGIKQGLKEVSTFTVDTCKSSDNHKCLLQTHQVMALSYLCGVTPRNDAAGVDRVVHAKPRLSWNWRISKNTSVYMAQGI